MAQEQEDEQDVRDEEEYRDPDNTDIFAKLFGPIKLLINIHLKIAAKEFKADSSRIVSGIINIVIGIIFFFTFLTLLNAFAISGLHLFFNFVANLGSFEWSSALKWFLAISSWTGLALLLAIFCFVNGAGKFKKKLFGKTRELIEETWKEIQ